jgi:hypothetical protein
MSCDAYVEPIVDLARGTAIEEETMARLQAHLAQCTACTAQLRREQTLTAGLAAVATAMRGARPSGALEGRLEQAFRERHAMLSIGDRSGWRPWMAAAAAVIVLAGAAVAWRPVTGRRSSGRPAAVVTGLGNPVAPNTPPANPAGSGPTSTSSSRVSPPSAHARPPRAGRPAFVQPAGFVALPGAASLPEFESGTIERVALSLSSLPVYGVDIAPDAAANPVQADLLVGQDGQARAIRLVTIASAAMSTRRAVSNPGSKQ